MLITHHLGGDNMAIHILVWWLSSSVKTHRWPMNQSMAKTIINGQMMIRSTWALVSINYYIDDGMPLILITNPYQPYTVVATDMMITIVNDCWHLTSSHTINPWPIPLSQRMVIIMIMMIWPLIWWWNTVLNFVLLAHLLAIRDVADDLGGFVTVTTWATCCSASARPMISAQWVSLSRAPFGSAVFDLTYSEVKNQFSGE